MSPEYLNPSNTPNSNARNALVLALNLAQRLGQLMNASLSPGRRNETPLSCYTPAGPSQVS